MDLKIPDPRNCLLGSGKILIARISAAGVLGAFFQVGNASRLACRATDDRATLPDYTSEDGGTYAEGLKSRAAEMSIRFHEYFRRNLSLLTLGTERDYTQSATPVTGEAFTAALELGGVYRTTKRNPGTVTIEQGVVELVVNVDYVWIDQVAGYFQILTTSTAAVAGAAGTIDFTPTAMIAGDQGKIDVYTEGTVLCQVAFLGRPRSGPKWEGRWYRCSIEPGEVDGFIGDDFAASELTLNVLSDRAGQFGGSANSPYGELLPRAA